MRVAERKASKVGAQQLHGHYAIEVNGNARDFLTLYLP